MARPKKDINWDLVEKRMEAGNSAREIAKHLRIDINTFYDRFKEEYGCGFSDFSDGIIECGKADIMFTQHMKALSGNVQMLVWLGKVKCGQKEPEITTNIASNQTQIDQSHRIMQLEHELAEIKEKYANT
jgi:hypothetical protein